MQRWILLILGIVLSTAACSDDTVGSSTVTCEFGERYNAILNTCEPVMAIGNPGEGTSETTGTTGTTGTSLNNGNPNPNGDGTNQTNNDTTGETSQPDMGMDTDGTDTDVPDAPPTVCGVGSVAGRACSPDGALLAAADVTITGIDCATGEMFTRTGRTDSNGTYLIENVPSGSHNLDITTGSFSANSLVFIRDGQLTDLTAASNKICLDGTAVKIAVIGGIYDHVEGILGSLNLSYDMKGDDGAQEAQASQFLQDPAAMAAYDIIFINCGELYQVLAPFLFGPDPRPMIANNLRNFVNQGGSLYVADWASPWAEIAFPEIMDMHGTDTVINDARRGYAPQTIIANVLSPELQAVLNSTTATIEFPHDPENDVFNNNWTVLDGAGPVTVVHLAGDALLCAGSTSCTNAGQTQAAAPLLVTWKATSGGTVTYTAFHNERQAGVNQDMAKILRFLIFQL